MRHALQEVRHKQARSVAQLVGGDVDADVECVTTHEPASEVLVRRRRIMIPVPVLASYWWQVLVGWTWLQCLVVSAFSH